MERLSEQLKVLDLKQASLRKMGDEIHAQCNTILLFTLQWKDLEQHFDSMRTQLLEQANELSFQEKQVVEASERVRANELEVENDMKEVRGFFKEMMDKEEQLGLLKGEVLECRSELERKGKELGSAQNKVRVCTEDLQGKERELGIVQRRLNEIKEEIAAKEEDLGLVNKSVDENCRKLKWRQKEVEEVVKMFSDCTCELQLKDKELSEVKELIRDCNAERKSEERKLAAAEKRIRHCCEELGLKEKELASVRKELGWRKEELERTRIELDKDRSEVDSVKLMIEEFSEELEMKEVKFNEVIKSVREKQKQLESLEKAYNKCNKKLESKMKKLDCVEEEIETSVKNLELKQAELSKIQCSIVKLGKVREQKQLSMQQALVEEYSRAVLECNDTSLGLGGEHILSECVMKLESRVAQLTSIETKLLDCNKRLAAKKQDVDSMKQKLEKHVEEIKLKEEELDSKQKLLEGRNAAVEEKEKEVNNLAEALQRSCAASSVEERSIRGGNGRNLQSILNQHFKSHDLLLSEVSSALLKSPDPARLVLDGIKGFYPQESGSNGEYELSAVRKSCIALLELLSRIISAQMNPQVYEESMELAGNWKSRVLGTAAPANSLEMLGLVKLISAFRLPRAFKQNLVKAVNPHLKADVKEEWGVLAFADNLIGSFILTPTRLADQLGNRIDHSSEGGDMSVTTSYEPLLPDEPLPSELSQNEITNCLANSPDPATMVFGLIRDSLVQHESGSIKLCDESVLRFRVLLLQQLMSMRPFVLPQVKVEVAELAVTWRGSLRMEAIDTLAFLLFLAAYGVATHFEQQEVANLAGTIAHYKRAPELWLALGLEGKVPGLIEGLMKKDMHVEAARFSCAFRLVNEYPPHLILLKFLEKRRTFESGKLLLEMQCEAFNKHMNFLKQLIQRVKDFNFDLSPLTSKLLEHLHELDRLLELKTSCLRGVATSIDLPQSQSGLEYRHHHGASGFVLPSYLVTGQSPAAAQHPTTFIQQQQQPNWIWEAGDLTYQAQRNKRTRTDHMQ